MKRLDKIKIMMLVGLVIAISGIIVSYYTLIHHFVVNAQGESSFTCNINEIFSCDKVALSKYSTVFGIPLGVWGIGYFVAVMMLLLITWLKTYLIIALQTYFAMSIIGILVSILAGLISYFLIGGFCPSCMTVYFICFLQIINIVVFWKVIPKPVRVKNVVFGGIYSSLIVVFIVIIFKIFEPLIQSIALSNTKIIDNVQSLITKEENTPPFIAFSFNKVNIHFTKTGENQDFYKGNVLNPVVTLTVFSDFKCPGCEVFAKYSQELFERYKDKMLMIFKNFPLDKECNPNIKSDYHINACLVAAAARCAGHKGYFWKFHDLAFENRRKINQYNILELLEKVGLGSIEADACLNNRKQYYKQIQADINEAQEFLEATPTVLLNGYQFVGNSYIYIDDMIQLLIKNPTKTLLDIQKEQLIKIKEYIQSGRAILVDVREKREWEKGHIKQAKLVSISQIQKFKMADFEKEFPKNKIFYTYCNSGSRSTMVANALRSIGYNIYALPVSLEVLADNGFEFIK